MSGAQSPDAVAIEGWWQAILAGGVDEPHPVHGDDLTVSVRHGTLRLMGMMSTEQDRQELLTRGREFVGHGIDRIDARHLKVAKRKEKAGVLEQVLFAAFRNRDVAELARKYLVDIRRLNAKQLEILDRGQEDKVRNLVPEGFVSDIEKALEAGEAVLIVRVDETEAFKVREMLAEDTRSRRTVATPPVPMAGKS
jgi:hypothetical protein